MQLTILMPCLNEAETLALCINKANAWISHSGIQAEVLIADNGSTDGSQAIAESLGARVVPVKQRGYGSALFHGCMAARGEWIIMGDSDDSYDFSNLDPFIQKLREGYDLVMGNRFLGGIAPGAMPWKNRYIGNPILTWVGRVLFKCPAKDFHCGLRGFQERCLFTDGFAHYRHGVRLGDGHQGQFVWDAYCRSANDVVEGRSFSPSSSSTLARRVEASSVYVAIQSTLAFFYTGVYFISNKHGKLCSVAIRSCPV